MTQLNSIHDQQSLDMGIRTRKYLWGWGRGEEFSHLILSNLRHKGIMKVSFTEFYINHKELDELAKDHISKRTFSSYILYIILSKNIQGTS